MKAQKYKICDGWSFIYGDKFITEYRFPFTRNLDIVFNKYGASYTNKEMREDECFNVCETEVSENITEVAIAAAKHKALYETMAKDFFR